MTAAEELSRLREELEALRARVEALSGAADAADHAPDGSGDRPVVLPRVDAVPVTQDTHLLHMAVKPFLRKRLGDRTNAAQVRLDVVERDTSGRERSWAHLPGPLPPGGVRAGGGEEPGSARIFETLGDATVRRVLGALWQTETTAAALATRAGTDEDRVRRCLGELQALGWVIEIPTGRYMLSQHGRRAAVCTWTLASALLAPR